MHDTVKTRNTYKLNGWKVMETSLIIFKWEKKYFALHISSSLLFHAV
jgi:hypothetical protein